MPVTNFENDKFIPAPLPETCMPRRGILYDCFKKIEESRLGVICAPAGYGKTVSALLWAKDSGRRSVWIGLDEYDNAPFVFYKLFCTGILSAQPGNANMMEILSSRDFYSSPVEHTLNFLMEFEQDGQSYTLILDDLHEITNKSILKSLPYILKRMPHSFDILLLSRVDLSEEFHDYIGSRNGIVITANELMFSVEEIQKYYGAMGRMITNAQAQSVFDMTGGWAIGINAISKSDRIETSQGGGQILENYIDKNIWEKWDSGMRRFMLATSVANEMDAELCDLLTGGKNSAGTLDNLVSQNFFVIKTSQSTYRYHHLFLEFLRGKLKECPDIDIKGLCLKIADLYFERQDFFKALAYYVHAENHSGLNRCFLKQNSGYLDFNIEEWLNYFTVFVFDKLPEEFIKSNISLVLESAWANYVNGNADTALRYIDIMNDYVSSEQNLHLMKENDFLGFVCTVRFFDFRKGIYEYAENFSGLIKTLSGQNRDYINIYTATVTENFPFAHRSIRDCLEIATDMDNKLQTIKEVFGTFFHKEADVLYYCVKAGLYYELNQLKKAYETILLAQCELKKGLRFEIEFCIFMALSQIHYAMGSTKESESVKQHFSGRLKEEKAFYLNPNFLAVEAKHQLWDADRETAKKWLDQFFVTNDEQLHFYKLYQYFTTVRAYIALSEPEKAMEYLTKLKRLSEEYRRPLDIAEAGVLQAVLNWATGYRKEAVKILEDTLLTLQPYRAIRIIADEGAAVLPILKKIALRAARPDYQGQLDKFYLNDVLLCAYEVSIKHKGITFYLNIKPVKLSKQQKLILTLLAQGYRNKEIIEITGLTINTIKSHTKAVYAKLNVNSAADAVLAAKRLGIIE